MLKLHGSTIRAVGWHPPIDGYAMLGQSRHRLALYVPGGDEGRRVARGLAQAAGPGHLGKLRGERPPVRHVERFDVGGFVCLAGPLD